MTEPTAIHVVRDETTIAIHPEATTIHVLTNAANTASGGSTQWQIVSANAEVVSGAYAVDALVLVILLLPAIAVVGQTFSVFALGVGGWRVAQRAGQRIRVGDKLTTLGAAGNIYSLSQGDYIKLTYLGNNIWVCTEIVGNLQVN